MSIRRFVVATAGHVDHGKSALVKALTGTDPDRLPEEKARQITMELGFAELNLTPDIHAAIVDVPGHEDFVRNMIAGVGSIDLALLIVAADDGWMAQTEEHLQILEYLGVKCAVIALTKIDIGDADRTEPQIREQLRETNFADSPIVPVSVRANVGLEELRRALAVELSKTEPQRDIGKPRLFVDRAFTLRGIGTVVTGTLTGGTFRRGQNVFVQPRNSRARIRSIQSHGRDVDLAQPGTRTAINLPDFAVGEISRGDVVTIEGFEPSSAIDVLLQRSPRLPRASAIKSGVTVYLHHGTSRRAAKIILFQDELLRGGENSVAQLRLTSPLLALIGDRFVIRDASEQRTIAGGVVLNPDGAQRNDATYRDWLRARATTYDDVDLSLASDMTRQEIVQRSALLRNARFSEAEVNSALQRLEQQHKIFVRGEIVAESRAWRLLRDRVAQLVDAAHKTNPERPGLELSQLRAALADQPIEVFDNVIVDLCAGSFMRVGSAIARRSHQPSLPETLRATAEKILKTISEKPFDPPSRKEIEADTAARNILRHLIDRGDIIEVSADVILLQQAFARMKEMIVAFIARNRAATVSEVRQELGTSRRIIVPLLELLDRQGVTRRIGDKRTLTNQTMTTPTRALN